ncbi:MAG: N-acetylmuramoyl-L-alanine amidase [Saprospiraceae bacterium]|nr:N-acetylmuramoyl-L-alanine amidase [Saprospiraceae bacterium]
MFKKFLDAIGNLFKSLFGGGTEPKPTPKPKPTDPNTEIPQDGSEITPDTIIIVADETENVIIKPDEKDIEFDDDLGVDENIPATIPDDNQNTDSGSETDESTTDEEGGSGGPVEGEVPQGRYLWCLDNGHGQYTKGKRSPVFDDGVTQFLEYEFNRDIVRRIMAQLDEHGISYYNVVPEVEVDDFLRERVDRANTKKSDLPKVFISVHSNAASARSSKHWAAASISGIETWYFHNSKKGRKVASIFQKHLIDQTGLKNRHLKSRPESQFFVLRKTRMTAVLTENGFYNNKAEAAKLMTDEMRQKIADAHVVAILEIEKNGI